MPAWLKPVMRSAMSKQVARSWSEATTWLTRPMRAASSASTSRPVNMISAARALPMARGKR